MFEDILNSAGNDMISVVDDGISTSDVESFIDTGSYAFNALVSGSIYKGMPGNKVIALAGEEATGKTFFALAMVRAFLDQHPDGYCVYFDSESALTKQMFIEREIDPKRVAIVPVMTIEDFRTQALRMVNKYLEVPKKDRKPMIMVQDSLGMLSTNKEVNDINNGSDKRDMTRSQLVRGAFRVLTPKLGIAGIPLVICNHVYEVIGSYIPKKEMGAGGGTKYAASTIIFLSKKKDRDGTEHTGNIIKCTAVKSRMTIEGKQVEVQLSFKTGLNRYYGLIQLAEAAGLVKKVSKKYEFPDGTKAFEKSINANPEKYFTEEMLQQIDEFAKKTFSYGSALDTTEEEVGQYFDESEEGDDE